MFRTMDFQDSNRDGIDDRDQDQFGRRTRFPGQPFQDTRARPPSYLNRTFQPERSIQDSFGGIAEIIRATRDAKGARTPPRFPGGQPPVKNYREQVIGRMPRPEFGRDTIPFVPPYMVGDMQDQIRRGGGSGPVRPPRVEVTTDSRFPRSPGQFPAPTPQYPGLPVPPRGGPARPPIGIPGFPERPPGRFPQPLPQPPGRFPQPPGNRFPQPQPPGRYPPPGRFPQPPGRFPQPPGRFPQPFPQPGRKGQRNIPQPGGYYPQPPSSPTYPGQFPSPGRKGNRGSYQQPQMPFGYGQMRDMSSRFGGYGMPQNIYGFQNPDYQPYVPPVFEAPPPGGPTPQPTPQPGPAPYPDPGPMPGPMPGPGPGGPGKGRGGPSRGGPMGPMPSPGGKGRGGPSPGQFPFVERYDGAPEYTTPFVENPALLGADDLMGPGTIMDFGPVSAGGGMDFGPSTASAGGGFMGNPDYYSNAGAELGGQFGSGGMGGGAKMKMGGQTAYPNQNVLSSYMMG